MITTRLVEQTMIVCDYCDRPKQTDESDPLNRNPIMTLAPGPDEQNHLHLHQRCVGLAAAHLRQCKPTAPRAG